MGTRMPGMEGDVSMSSTDERPQELDFLGYGGGIVPFASSDVDFHRDVAMLARRVHAETRPHYEPVAAEFAALATTHLESVAEAGALLLLGKAGWRSVSELETSAALIEQLHMDLRDGPAIDAAQDTKVVRVADLTSETQWPRFSDAAVANTPVRSLLCIPLYTHIHTWGALMLLSHRPNGLDHGTEQAGAILATHAALTLEAMHHDRHYRSALGSRDIIGQAKGVLMERFDIDAGAAFALLTRLAEESHRPVVVVAKEMLETKLDGRP